MNCRRLVFAAGLCAIPILAGGMDLSGSVLGADRKPIAGVQVRLAGGNVVTTTDAMGEWSIQAPPTRIGAFEVRRKDTPRSTVVMENGRLSVSFAGRGPTGREANVRGLSSGANFVAARRQDVPDTLDFSLGGKVLLRDTVSASRKGIVRILDSTFNPNVVYGYLTDSRDGRIYRTVKIGNQVCMAENLEFEVGKSWWYNDNPDHGARYGRLYTWVTALTLPDSCKEKMCGRQIQSRHRGICPEGWHIPDLAEWNDLATAAGGRSRAGSGLKSAAGWRDNGSGADTYGFRGLPGGFGFANTTFSGIGERGNWWSVVESEEKRGLNQILEGEYASLSHGGNSKSDGISVRCVQGGGGEVPDPVGIREGMKLIPAGPFVMGSPATEVGRLKSETQHVVTLSAFWMDSTPVTQGQYQAVMGVNPSYYLRCGALCPVEDVTWYDAVLYCNARSRRDGLDTVYTYTAMSGTYGDGVSALTGLEADQARNGYRLPTEAQWEYAARGGTTTAYYWGNSASADTLSKYAWSSLNSNGITKPVATKPANPFGLFDMAGNVSEWTNDWYGEYATIEQSDPDGPSSGSERVFRGCSWFNSDTYLRSARRGGSYPDRRSMDMGFRAVRPAR